MAEHKKKSLTYSRAQWIEALPTNTTFETFIRQTCTKLKTVNETAVARDNGQVISRAKFHYRKSGGVYLHLTAITPDEEASIVNKTELKNADELDVGTAKPPEDNEFMDGDVFIFIKENDVCMCATVLHEVTIASYFYQLFRNAKLNPQAMKFLIKRVADIKKINLLRVCPETSDGI